MKNIFKMVLVLSLMLVSVFVIAAVARAAEDDIVVSEVVPDVVKYEINTITLYRFEQTAVINWLKVDANGNPVGNGVNVIFSNKNDDPSTPDVDETSTEFTTFYDFLHTRIIAGDSLKLAVQKACKVKLGI